MTPQDFLRAQLPKNLSRANFDNKLDATEHFRISRALQCSQARYPVIDPYSALTGGIKRIEVALSRQCVLFVRSYEKVFPLLRRFEEPAARLSNFIHPRRQPVHPHENFSASILRRKIFVKYFFSPCRKVPPRITSRTKKRQPRISSRLPEVQGLRLGFKPAS